MKRAVAIIVGLVMVCLVAYLSWLNPTRVEFRFSPTHSVHDFPLGPLMVFAWIAGAVVVLAVMMIQAGRRAVTSWRQERQQRRTERIDDWEERGELLVWQGDTQQGRALLQKAWQRRPESAHAVLALAASYQDTGELQRARRLLAEAAAQHHTNPDVLLALAESHRAAGDHPACIEILERLRALQPRAPRVLRALRERYVAAERWRDAVTVQEALLAEMRDADGAAHERETLTALRYQSGLTIAEPAARVGALEALADSRAGSVPIMVSLGDALLANGDAAEASVLWERALRSTPRTVFVERLAAIATEPRHRDRLRTVLRKLRPDHVRADNVRLLSAQLLLADGHIDDAARELDAVQHPDQAPALLHRLWGEVHRRRGQQEQAVLAFARANAGGRHFACHVCRRSEDSWTGYCTQCGQWDSYRAEVEIGAE
jgi:tetratricopeptide (TPR) repeat protein